MTNAALALAARVMMAGIFGWEAWVIARNPSGAVDYMEAFGVPGFLMPPVVLFQIVGALALVLGWRARLVALAFAAYSAMTAIVFHLQPGDGGEILHFGKNVAMAGGFVFLYLAGPGRFSIDAASADESAGEAVGPER